MNSSDFRTLVAQHFLTGLALRLSNPTSTVKRRIPENRAKRLSAKPLNPIPTPVDQFPAVVLRANPKSRQSGARGEGDTPIAFASNWTRARFASL